MEFPRNLDELAGSVTQTAGDVSQQPPTDSDASNSCAIPYRCAICARPITCASPLIRCCGCKSVSYCSPGCATVDWNVKKKLCMRTIFDHESQSRNVTGSGGLKTPEPSTDPDWETVDEEAEEEQKESEEQGNAGRVGSDDTKEDRAFERALYAIHWEGLSDRIAFSHIIDAYRFRVQDEYVSSGSTRGVYKGDDPLADFRRFLDNAEKRKGLLPSWWSKSKRATCDKLARRGRWTNITATIEEDDISQHYGDHMLPMFLRIFAERAELKSVLGTPVVP